MLSDRVCQSERRIASFSNTARMFEAVNESREEGLERLHLAVYDLEEPRVRTTLG
jgi:hypothetical protein